MKNNDFQFHLSFDFIFVLIWFEHTIYFEMNKIDKYLLSEYFSTYSILTFLPDLDEGEIDDKGQYYFWEW